MWFGPFPSSERGKQEYPIALIKNMIGSPFPLKLACHLPNKSFCELQLLLHLLHKGSTCNIKLK